jgi:putative transposase
MGIQAAPEVKFALIREATMRDNNLLKISTMCEIAGVSRSGYYRWCDVEDARKAREDADRLDFDLILEAYQYRGYAKGARGIHMRLLHKPGIIMNVKKIRRLMHKYGLKCPIRKANPYRRMAKALATNTVAENVVNRDFRRGARKVLLTDITYLFFGKGGKCYLSTILDAYTHEVLAYKVSLSLKVDFVLETVNRLIAEHGCTLDNETIVHSDQGCHYTSYAFIEKLKDAEFVQSMSRRGNCWDNAPQESFFGHMKDEISDMIAACKTFEDVTARIDDWMDYYNNDRGQWDLLKLTPSEYYKYLQTGIYPLPVYDKNPSRGSAPDPEV